MKNVPEWNAKCQVVPPKCHGGGLGLADQPQVEQFPNISGCCFLVLGKGGTKAHLKKDLVGQKDMIIIKF